MTTGTALLASLRGHWTFDPAHSHIPNGGDVEIIEPLVVDLDDQGAYRASAPMIEVASGLGPFRASVEVAGRIVVTGEFTAEHGAAVEFEDLVVLRRALDFSQMNLPFDPGGIVSPLFDMLLTKAAGPATLILERDGGDDLLGIQRGEVMHRLRRASEVLSARVLDITFDDGHRVREATPGDAGRFRSPGRALTSAHWEYNGRNVSACYIRGGRIAVTVSVRVAPAGSKVKLFGICKEQPFGNYESDVFQATGQLQQITMHGKGPLPRRVCHTSMSILWNVQDVDSGQWSNAGTSGPHSVFTVVAEPRKENSFGNSLFLTERRLDFIMRAVRGVPENRIDDVHEHGWWIQQAANHPGVLEPGVKTIVASPSSTLNTGGRAQQPDEIWSLLDLESTDRGNCGEATMLMECMLRSLGVDAYQTHVLASSSPAVCRAGDNYRAIVEGKTLGAGYDERMCEHHPVPRKEILAMAFNPAPQPGQTIAPNDGEGCVMIAGALYSGLLPYSATDDAEAKAAYNMLYNLEQIVASRENPVCKFQVWTYERVENGVYVATDVCEFDSPSAADMSRRAPFGEAVPKFRTSPPALPTR